MKQKVFAILAGFLLFCGLAAAQGYSIRVASNTNLRVSNSLSASTVETIPAGTTLTVLGEVNRWLRISRDGREVRMASWVRHERVEGGVQTQSQTTSTVDNCCFVDRQCQTDQDWTDGYWAFQNNECQAPTGSQTPASSRLASGVIFRSASGIVIGSASERSILPSTSPTILPTLGQTVSYEYNNCCQYHWQCNSDQDWAEGYRAYQSNLHCALPGLISIVGDPDFVDFYAQA